MRSVHHADISAWHGAVVVDSLVANRFNAGGQMWAICDDLGIPFVAGGVLEERPGVGTWWMLATPSVTKHPKRLIRFGRQVVRTLLDTGQLHRIEAYCMESWPQACRVAEAIGMQREGRHPHKGANGETMISYAAHVFREKVSTSRQLSGDSGAAA